MRARKIITAGLLVVTAGLVLAGCGSDDKNETSNSTSATTLADDASAAAPTQLLIAGDFLFVHNTMTARVGQTLTMEIKNQGPSLHNFSITEFKVSKDVPVGPNAFFDVRVTRAGEFEYFCTFHKAKGMSGVLTVS